MRSSKFFFLIASGLVLMLLILPMGCSEEKPEKPQKPEKAEKPIQPSGPAPNVLPALKLQAFADLPPQEPLAVTPALQDRATVVDKAVNYREVMKFLGLKLSRAQKDFLNRHKFLLIPKDATRFKGEVDFRSPPNWRALDEMLGLFDEVSGYAAVERKPENAHLVNPDALLHAYHKYVENSLEYLEKTNLAPQLSQFVQQLQTQAFAFQKISRGDLARHYELIAAQMTVAVIILQNARWPVKMGKSTRLPDPEEQKKPDQDDSLENALGLLKQYQANFSPETLGKVTAEIRYIYEIKDSTATPAKSPLFGHYDKFYNVDYTQFTPRSHYTKSSLLRAYFRAMMYLGKNYYNLKNSDGMTDALLLAHIMATPDIKGRRPLEDWQRLMEITSFYVGLSDDISYPEWRDFIVKVAGGEKFTPGDALSPDLHKKIEARLKELKPPVTALTRGEQVDIGKVNFRIFGQRFTFDAWILSHLTAKAPGNTPPLPTTPSALFVPAAMGNPWARGFMPPVLRQEMPGISPAQMDLFDAKFQRVSGILGKVDEAAWFSSIGWVWLKLLGTLNASYSRGYPLYMQSRLFPIKQLQTFLGSYTELKHDTLLYAKQSYAELGDGEDEGKPPPVPKGFVEPNLVFWQTLQRLVAYTSAGYHKYNLFPLELEEHGRLQEFKRQVEFYTSMAVKELRGQPLTEAEYEKIRTKELSYMAEPFDYHSGEYKDLRSGLIADVHTDLFKNQVLYEATGEPYVMLALVGNESQTRLTIGVAFNHYEFTGPLTTRYTDADWQARVYETPKKLPPKNFWYGDLLVK
jgi:hypothetical protein